MPRWDPDARGRLESAALDLFVEQGYDATTVAQIADRAGLTRSTFFRQFADKREVVFGPQNLLADLLADAVRAAPGGLPVERYLLAAFERAAEQAFTPERHRMAVQRRQVVAANTDLRERELLKQAGIVDVLAAAFGAHGLDALDARIAAELAALVLHTAFEQWAVPGAPTPFGDIARQVVGSVVRRAGVLTAS